MLFRSPQAETLITHTHTPALVQRECVPEFVAVQSGVWAAQAVQGASQVGKGLHVAMSHGGRDVPTTQGKPHSQCGS